MNNRKTVYYWLRVINDLSQEEVASKLSIPLSYIQELEFGSKKPSKELLSEYAKFFVIAESELENFDRDNKNKTTTEHHDKVQSRWRG